MTVRVAFTDDAITIGVRDNGHGDIEQLRGLEREPDLAVIADASDAESALLAAQQHRSDVVILTTFVDEQLVREAIQRGAKGYVLRDVDVAQLTRIIRDVDRGTPASTARARP